VLFITLAVIFSREEKVEALFYFLTNNIFPLLSLSSYEVRVNFNGKALWGVNEHIRRVRAV
jgi:hypothetical protein